MLFNEQQKTWHFDACNCVAKHTDEQTGWQASEQQTVSKRKNDTNKTTESEQRDTNLHMKL